MNKLTKKQILALKAELKQMKIDDEKERSSLQHWEDAQFHLKALDNLGIELDYCLKSPIVDKAQRNKNYEIRENREREIFREILNSNYYLICCNCVFCYDVPNNYRFTDRLSKKFPKGIGDAESGGGWFYIHESFKEEVLAFLADRDVEEPEGAMDQFDVDDCTITMFNWANLKSKNGKHQNI